MEAGAHAPAAATSSVRVPSVPVPSVPVTPAASDSTPLTVAAMPPAALAALRESAPTFVPFDPSTYPPNTVAATHKSADEGLMIIRADLQGEGRVDYAVAGMDKGSLRVIAIFAQIDGGFRVVGVFSEEPPLPYSAPPGAPGVALERAKCEFRCATKTEFDVVTKYVGDDSGKTPSHYVWLPKFSKFSLDEVVD